LDENEKVNTEMAERNNHLNQKLSFLQAELHEVRGSLMDEKKR
jgi:hypothetical protein